MTSESGESMCLSYSSVQLSVGIGSLLFVFSVSTVYSFLYDSCNPGQKVTNEDWYGNVWFGFIEWFDLTIIVCIQSRLVGYYLYKQERWDKRMITVVTYSPHELWIIVVVRRIIISHLNISVYFLFWDLLKPRCYGPYGFWGCFVLISLLSRIVSGSVSYKFNSKCFGEDVEILTKCNFLPVIIEFGYVFWW